MDAGRAGDAVSSAFARIAEELVESMMRNLAGHRAEELVEGFEWAQWQALALQSLMGYSRRNAVAYGPEFDRLNDLIEQAIRQAWEDGGADAEAQILEAVRSGWTPPAGAPGDNPGAPAGGSFFQVPERRLDALVKATHDDMMQAEHALLRKADDVYRETVFAAQVYGTSGAGTLAKAVDMAAKDFLGKGICCIEYADGSVHSIEEYSRMAVRTAVKRAQLAGDGSKRAEWGVHTVIVARNSQGCGKCAQWSGQVLVDDVYSGGTAREAEAGGWSLLSSAMAAGLFHPNCRDMTSTWFPGLSPEPDPPTQAQREAADRRERAEQAETHAQTMARRYGRMSRLALDEGNRERYAAKAVEWEMRAEEVADAVPAAEPADAFVPAGTLEEAEEFAKGLGVKFAVFGDMSVEVANLTNRALMTLPAEAMPKAVSSVRNLQKAVDRKFGKLKAFHGVTVDMHSDINFYRVTGDMDMVDFDGGVCIGLNIPKGRGLSGIAERKKAFNAEWKAKTGRTWYFNESGETVPFHEAGHAYAKRFGLPPGFENAARKWADESGCDMLANPDEAWAEAWAAYHTGEGRLPEEIEEFIAKASKGREVL